LRLRRIDRNIPDVITPPILDNKRASSESVFTPSALLREARRQKGLDDVQAPSVCILDPDGDWCVGCV
jgi:hypothetical protein